MFPAPVIWYFTVGFFTANFFEKNRPCPFSLSAPASRAGLEHCRKQEEGYIMHPVIASRVLCIFPRPHRHCGCLKHGACLSSFIGLVTSTYLLKATILRCGNYILPKLELKSLTNISLQSVWCQGNLGNLNRYRALKSHSCVQQQILVCYQFQGNTAKDFWTI